jgi:beta-lysine N6-acetyltransferase
MAVDMVRKIGGSVLQHGKHNDRVYVMKLEVVDAINVAEAVEELMTKHDYSKVVAKVPSSCSTYFADRGYVEEARVPRLYNLGRDDGLFLVRYAKDWRRVRESEAEIRRLTAAAASRKEVAPPALPAGFTLRELSSLDADAMARVYKEVFESYPFPIHDPTYLRKTLTANVRYFGVEAPGEGLVALSSAEMDKVGGNVEMTDFATLTPHRGRGLALHLLRAMQKAMAAVGFSMAYTIARALSPGMNMTFGKAGYRHGGTLWTNTNIGGSMESMNVWYRALQPAS